MQEPEFVIQQAARGDIQAFELIVQPLAQLISGTESPDEVLEMTGITLTGDAKQLVPVLFPMQYPQLENQAL